LIAALAGGATIAAPAMVAGVSEATVYRRLNDESFRRAVDEARAVIVVQSTSRLAGASAAAIDALQALLKSQKDATRLGAARAILDLSIRYREHVELANRVAQLEREATVEEHGTGDPQ
jgi:hypothetical protein